MMDMNRELMLTDRWVRTVFTEGVYSVPVFVNNSDNPRLVGYISSHEVLTVDDVRRGLRIARKNSKVMDLLRGGDIGTIIL